MLFAVIGGTAASPSPNADKITPEQYRPEKTGWSTQRQSGFSASLHPQTNFFAIDLWIFSSPSSPNRQSTTATTHNRNGCHIVRLPLNIPQLNSEASVIVVVLSRWSCCCDQCSAPARFLPCVVVCLGRFEMHFRAH